MNYNFSDNEGVNTLLKKILDDVGQFTESQIEHIGKLNKIGVSLSAESNRDKLLEMILDQAQNFTNCDGGTLYMVTDDKKFLEFNVVINDSLNTKMGGTRGEITWPQLPLYKEDGSENREMVAVLSALTGELINIEDVYEAEGFNFEGTKKFDQGTGYRSKSMLVIPMKNYDGDVVGVLQLINRQDDSDKSVIKFSHEDEESTKSLASQAAMAITNLRLINELEALLESFIKSIASAIDAKSPYTGGHVRKVAVITMMIAEKLNSCNSGKYKDIFYDHDRMNELRISALMHDVGKITTPEYVVDKSKKLETIYDRIETVKTRLEVLKRDIEISYLKNEITEEEFKAEIEKVEDDVKFLTVTNIGGEFMSDDKIQRVEEIAGKKVFINNEETDLLTDNEVYNLSIRKGTLTNEERDVINDHANMSVKMLEALPFPKKLNRVPEIAGGHHEKLNGKGYPRGLTAEELTLESRILAVADVFEALTASDRPYKDAKRMSEVMRIIGFMVKDMELDPDLVDFFYEQNIHIEYALKELKEEQLDI